MMMKLAPIVCLLFTAVAGEELSEKQEFFTGSGYGSFGTFSGNKKILQNIFADVLDPVGMYCNRKSLNKKKQHLYDNSDH